jgi:hypothetical protein
MEDEGSARERAESRRGLVSVAVGNTTTRMVLWRSQAEEGIVVCTGETASLKSDEGEALRHLISTLRQHLKVPPPPQHLHPHQYPSPARAAQLTIVHRTKNRRTWEKTRWTW